MIGRNADALLVDQEGIFVGPVGAAAILHDAQSPGGDLVDHPMVEQDHTIGDVFFQALSRQGALAPLARDDGCNTLVFEPAEQAPQLRAQDCRVATDR